MNNLTYLSCSAFSCLYMQNIPQNMYWFCSAVLYFWYITPFRRFVWFIYPSYITADEYRPLSHTWVRYPGFSGHRVKCPILTTVVPGFSGDLIGCTIRSKWVPFGDLYLARKILFVFEIGCFWVKYSFPKWELVLWSLHVDKLSVCRNLQMHGKI